MRKLLRVPRAVRDKFAITMKAGKSRMIGGPKLKFSVVSAVYNVEKYLDDYFRSIVLQPEFLGQIQLIVVNDGSTDGSLKILQSWAKRFPNNITVLSQSNAGQSAAENHGLEYAKGEWITFTDPDDCVGQEYFSSVSQFIRAYDNNDHPLQLVACNFIIYYEHGDRTIDNHALKHRFSKDAAHTLADIKNNIHIHAGSTFFRGCKLRELALSFDPRVLPVFQDGHFTARFMMACDNSSIGFCRGAKYYYRKRGDLSSTIDTSHQKLSRFDDVYRYGHLPILQGAKERLGSVPRWLQRTVLYEVTWEIRRIANAPACVAFLSSDQLATFRELLERVFSYIDADTIRTFELAGANDFIRAGMLRRFKKLDVSPGDLIVRLCSADKERNTYILHWFSGSPSSSFSATIDGVAVQVLDRKDVSTALLDEPFVYETRVEIAGARTGKLVVKVGDLQTRIQCVGRPWPSCDLKSAFEKLTKPKIQVTTGRSQTLRAKSRERDIVDRYGGAWLLMDRDVQADDNAEHLYRHIKKHRPDLNAFFVLRSTSRDWPRLRDEGFRLLEYGSEQHKLALLNARYLVSSHADHYVTNYLPNSEFGDLLTFKFVFLQHGVTKDDISDWLNRKNIDLMCAATRQEFQSLASPVNTYKMFPGQVALTGFARHDALIAPKTPHLRRLLIMPTWRNALVGKQVGASNNREFRHEFLESEYLMTWRSLLGSERLQKAVEQNGFDVIFFPHVNVEMYLEHFRVPPYIRCLTHSAEHSIQDLFQSSAMLLTDFSSVAFEMAYLCRPVIYYQFDRDKVFGGGHLTRKGYFNYERDGFGPVCIDETSVLNAIDTLLAGHGTSNGEYAMRSLTTFTWRDRNCCARIVDAIQQLDARVANDTRPLKNAECEPEFDVYWAPRKRGSREMARGEKLDVAGLMLHHEGGC